MSWAEVRRKARNTVHNTFEYDVSVALAVGGPLVVKAKWHRQQLDIGEDDRGWTRAASESDQLVFLVDEVTTEAPKVGQIVTIDDAGTPVLVRVTNVEPADHPTVTCDVVPVV